MQRARATQKAGNPGPEGSVAKLAQAEINKRLAELRDLDFVKKSDGGYMLTADGAHLVVRHESISSDIDQERLCRTALIDLTHVEQAQSAFSKEELRVRGKLVPTPEAAAGARPNLEAISLVASHLLPAWEKLGLDCQVLAIGPEPPRRR